MQKDTSSMKQVFKSKVAKWYICLCLGMTAAFIGSIYLCYTSTWILLIDSLFMGIGVLLVYDMLLHTDYTVADGKLHIRCGFLFRTDIPVARITEITHQSTVLSSPALSAGRICLKYGRTNRVYVSPDDPEGFISALKAINPDIAVS